jgi:hypothetical protein
MEARNMATTQITDTVEAITLEDAKNAYAWAKKNLSEKRAAAFFNALRKLENEKHSREYWDASRAADAIADDYYRTHFDRVAEIEKLADAQSRSIDEKINELYALQRSIREEARNQVAKIRVQGYSLPEYKEADLKMREIGNREQEAHLPKVAALMQKYLDRHMAAITADAIQENNR